MHWDWPKIRCDEESWILFTRYSQANSLENNTVYLLYLERRRELHTAPPVTCYLEEGCGDGARVVNGTKVVVLCGTLKRQLFGNFFPSLWIEPIINRKWISPFTSVQKKHVINIINLCNAFIKFIVMVFHMEIYLQHIGPCVSN